MLVGPMLGMATRALELVMQQAATKGIAYTCYQPQSSSVSFQHQLAEEAVDILMTIGGAGGFAESSPLAKIWRDMNVCARHVIVTPDVNQEIYGRALLGVEETATPLV